jgi:hypothetical protein
VSAEWLAAIAATATACASPVKRSATSAPTLEADRGELVLTTHDGRTLRSVDLVGAILEVGDSLVRLDAIQRDPNAHDRLLLHHFTVIPRRGPPSELCTPDSAGQRWAMAIQDERGQVQLVCSSGAIGKCIRWGYPPIRNTTKSQPFVRYTTRASASLASSLARTPLPGPRRTAAWGDGRGRMTVHSWT